MELVMVDDAAAATAPAATHNRIQKSYQKMKCTHKPEHVHIDCLKTMLWSWLIYEVVLRDIAVLTRSVFFNDRSPQIIESTVCLLLLLFYIDFSAFHFMFYFMCDNPVENYVLMRHRLECELFLWAQCNPQNMYRQTKLTVLWYFTFENMRGGGYKDRYDMKSTDRDAEKTIILNSLK